MIQAQELCKDWGVICHRDPFAVGLPPLETARSTTKAEIYQAIAQVEAHVHLLATTDGLSAYLNMITERS